MKYTFKQLKAVATIAGYFFNTDQSGNLMISITGPDDIYHKFDPMHNVDQLLDMSKRLLMELDCEFVTDDGYYFVYQHVDVGKVMLSHEAIYDKAIVEAYLEIYDYKLETDV